MGEWPFLWRVLHEHRDRRTNTLIDEHHEYLVLVAKKNCAAAAGRSQSTNLNFDNGLTSYCKSSYPPSRQDPNRGPHRCRPSDLFRVGLNNQMYRWIYY